jgi:hypothetical protein
MSLVNGPVLQRVDTDQSSFVFRGPFGTDYAISTSTAGFSVEHGQFLRHKYSGRVCFVIGTFRSSLWVQFTDEGHAVSLKGADIPDFIPATVDGQEAPGPLLLPYIFSTKNLEVDFEVKPQKLYHLRLLGEDVVIVGQLLGVLWVRKQSQSSVATPLVRCTSAELLRSLYGLCEIVPGSDVPVPSPRVSSTPRSIPAFKLSEDRHKAACYGPFGARFDANATAAAMKPFGVTHGQRLMGTAGLSNGKLAVAVGVHLGNLVVHVEGDSKVTIVRNCESASDLAMLFTTGKKSDAAQPAAAKAQPAASKPREPSPEAAQQLRTAIPPLKIPVAGGDSAAERRSKSASPGRSASAFLCWTAFGRYSFDTAGSRKFGFKHGQSVRCTKGAESGKLFHVVGSCHGNLWVIPDGKLRAIPLLFCDTDKDIEERYGFVESGTTDLTRYHLAEEEPAASPMSSPRSAVMATPRLHKLDVGGELVFSPASEAKNRSLNFSSPRSVVASSVPEAVPPPVAMESSSAMQQAANCPPTRVYLKAVALVNLGFPSSGSAPMAFHEFYMTSTIPRLYGALKRMPHAKGVWDAANKDKRFEHATVDEMVAVFGQHRDAFFL